MKKVGKRILQRVGVGRSLHEQYPELAKGYLVGEAVDPAPASRS